MALDLSQLVLGLLTVLISLLLVYLKRDKLKGTYISLILDLSTSDQAQLFGIGPARPSLCCQHITASLIIHSMSTMPAPISINFFFGTEMVSQHSR